MTDGVVAVGILINMQSPSPALDQNIIAEPCARQHIRSLCVWVCVCVSVCCFWINDDSAVLSWKLVVSQVSKELFKTNANRKE